MADKIKCVDGCGEMIPADTPRPEYIVVATGHPIRPRARCADCREAYEAKRLKTRNPKGGLKLAVTSG